jgi:hypothetical protein
MEALAISAVKVMQSVEMTDAINDRLFSRGPEELLEYIESTEKRRLRRYRPMVELLLREIVAIGADESLDIVRRRQRIEWALEMAGF